ncbi:MAG: ABC transporter substrate-binding protein [Thermodesulfobacteriota bacterium]
MRHGFAASICIMILLLGGAVLDNARAQEYRENDVVVGINVPLSGPYKSQGKEQEKTCLMAIKRLNARGGLLIKDIKYVVKDTESDPEVARENAVELIREYNADMITGGVANAVARAQSDVCQEYGVPFMAAMAHSRVLTGYDKTGSGSTEQKAHRHTFRWYLNDWMSKEALVPFLVKKFGTGTDYFHITMDTIWGNNLQKGISMGTGLKGCNTVKTVKTPPGNDDFSKELKQVQKSSADVLVLNLFGPDLVNAMQQVKEMGINKSVHIVVPAMEINTAHQIDNKVLQDTYSTTSWYHGLGERFSGSKDFIQAFSQWYPDYNRPPGASAACAWVAINEWADAVSRAGTTDSNKVIPELEDHEFTLLKEKEKWRSFDHQAIGSVFVVKGKAPGNMDNEWDVLQILDSVPGSEVVRSQTDNPVMLEPFD